MLTFRLGARCLAAHLALEQDRDHGFLSDTRGFVGLFEKSRHPRQGEVVRAHRWIAQPAEVLFEVTLGTRFTQVLLEGVFELVGVDTQNEFLRFARDLFEKIRTREARGALGHVDAELGQMFGDGNVELGAQLGERITRFKVGPQTMEALRLIFPCRPLLAVRVERPEHGGESARRRREPQ